MLEPEEEPTEPPNWEGPYNWVPGDTLDGRMDLGYDEDQ